MTNRYHLRCLALVLTLLTGTSAFAITSSTTTTQVQPKKRRRPVRRAKAAVVQHSRTDAAVLHATAGAARLKTVSRRRRRRVFYNPWTEPTYADSTVGDNVDGEELLIRKAAVDALGPYNGTVVVTDPENGRVLTIVNQKLALKGAYQPCSTVKILISLASLTEGVLDPEAPVRIGRRTSMNLTRALAKSNNFYFAKLGQQLGFDKVTHYGKLYGLGEKAGLDIPGEEPGTIADEVPASGIGMMTSFGDGIRVTPLELASIVGTVANGGTMYYLQYPKSQAQVDGFVPRIKRSLDIANFIPPVKAGMQGAVEFGTAVRAKFDETDPILGKTGTCTDTAQPGVHLGWFGSFNQVGSHKIVVIVLLTGGRGISGPIASGVAGNVYHNLAAQNYFGPNQPVVPTSLVSMGTSSE